MARFLPYLYFAYGSNLSLQRMYRRCPSSESYAPFKVRGWRLEFCGLTGVANAAEGAPADWLRGALYNVTSDCERKLDRCEGYKTHEPDKGVYRKIDFRIPSMGVEAFMYLHNDPSPGVPSHHYINHLRRGYKDWGFDVKSLMSIAHAHGYRPPQPSIVIIGDREPEPEVVRSNVKGWPRDWQTNNDTRLYEEWPENDPLTPSDKTREKAIAEFVRRELDAAKLRAAAEKANREAIVKMRAKRKAKGQPLVFNGSKDAVNGIDKLKHGSANDDTADDVNGVGTGNRFPP